MKLCVAHPFRNWWLLLKSFFCSACNRRPTHEAAHHKPHRTTAFFELP